jgi:hypothetical protein
MFEFRDGSQALSVRGVLGDLSNELGEFVPIAG